jgi:Nuclease-related domain
VSEEGLVVKRWKRYGKDRLYVTLPDGTKAGFWDLASDEGHPEAQEQLPILLRAVEGWRGNQEADLAPVPVPLTAAPLPAAGGLKNQPVGSMVSQHLATADTLTALDEAVLGEEPVARPWMDLATNQPGAEAREQAEAAREAAPVKTVLARVLGVHTEERAWRIGADGEEKVAGQLAKVAKKDPRWRVLHAIPVGDRGSDIDHLVIGPGGVFTVNTKNHPGAKIWVGGNTFMVNGHRQPYVRNSRHEAERAARLLTTACGYPVYVQGLIVTVNADDVVIKTQPDGVNVTWRNNLAKWLLRHGEIHPPEMLDTIYEAARRSTTWLT